MLGSNRNIFNAPGNSPYSSFSSISSSTALFGCGYDNGMSMGYYVITPITTDITSTMKADSTEGTINGAGGVANGYGWCGVCTFKVRPMSYYTWGDTFWTDPNVERIRCWNWDGAYSTELFMFDGVLKNFWNATDGYYGNFYPVTPCRKKNTYQFGFTTEYGQFDGVWFDNILWDDVADRWLSIVWSHGDGSTQSWTAEDSKYATAGGGTWNNKKSTYCLYDAVTGELLATTKKWTGDSFAGGSGGGLQDYGYSDWVFTSQWLEGRSFDFELNNNSNSTHDGPMIQVESVWYSIGGASEAYGISPPWDPVSLDNTNDLVLLNAKRPKQIAGRNALINIRITGDSGGYSYGFGPAICGVTSPSGAFMVADTNRPLSTDHPGA